MILTALFSKECLPVVGVVLKGKLGLHQSGPVVRKKFLHTQARNDPRLRPDRPEEWRISARCARARWKALADARAADGQKLSFQVGSVAVT